MDRREEAAARFIARDDELGLEVGTRVSTRRIARVDWQAVGVDEKEIKNFLFAKLHGWFLNPRSGWQRKAWGEAQRNPRTIDAKTFAKPAERARERGGCGRLDDIE
jgi:hypothetical protein